MELNNLFKLNRIVLFSSEQLKPGDRKIVQIDNIEIALLNIDEKFYAIRNTCPHQGVQMIHGPVTGTMLPSKPHEYEYGCLNEIIRCPLHGWEFSLKTGKSVFSPDKVSILTYEIHKEEESIVLYLKRKPQNITILDFICPSKKDEVLNGN